MPPAPFLEAASVVDARDRLRDLLNVNFDCALCNLYQDEKAACRWHADPEHGKMWALDTVVVSAGETRRFALRRIENEDEVFSFHMFAGDVAWMYGDCQERWHHAVLGPETPDNTGERVSLVFKRALLGPNGKKGHGVPGSASRTGRGQGPQRRPSRGGRGGRGAGRGSLPSKGRSAARGKAKSGRSSDRGDQRR
eukprot:scaffold1060_cov246-Pinguiococcus_pyrenoidosus.AAC.15